MKLTIEIEVPEVKRHTLPVLVLDISNQLIHYNPDGISDDGLLPRHSRSVLLGGERVGSWKVNPDG